METIRLDIASSDFPYFDKFVRNELIKPPVNSLRSSGSYDRKLHLSNRDYLIGIKKDQKDITFRINVSLNEMNIQPLQISINEDTDLNNFSEQEIKEFFSIIISRIKVAEKLAKDKPLQTFRYIARLSTGPNVIKSTIVFDKYTIIPSETTDEQGYECKLKFVVESIDHDFSVTDAILESKIIAAWLTLIFSKPIRFKGFTMEITPEPKPIVHYEKINRPDLRSVKHSFNEELKIPRDFQILWKNFTLLPPEIWKSFIDSCMAYQAAIDMQRYYLALSYQLFVTSIEVISKETMKHVGPQKRFIEFISLSLNKESEKQFTKNLENFYARRSSIVHEKGIGFGLIPTGFDTRSYEEIPYEELWDLEIFVNAALISFLKKPFKLILEKKMLFFDK